MKRFILLSLLSLFLLSSCEVIDDLINQLQQEPGCQLIKTELDIPNDPAKSIKEFTYNSDNLLTEVKESEYDLDPTPYITRYEMTYSDKKLTELKAYNKFQTNAEELNHVYSFSYSGDHPDSIHVQNYDSWGNSEGYYLAEYNGDKLSKLIYYHIDAATGIAAEHNSFTLTWTGENVTKVSSQYPNANPTVYAYTYDDKKAPLTSIGLGISQQSEFSILSANNVTKRTVTIGSNNPNVTDYELTYNEEGYLASRRDIQTWNTWPTTYEYNCQ